MIFANFFIRHISPRKALKIAYHCNTPEHKTLNYPKLELKTKNKPNKTEINDYILIN